MKKNMGTLDKTIRISITLLVVVLYFTNIINGLAAIILGGLSIIFLVTSFISFCPLYFPFKISTRKK